MRARWSKRYWWWSALVVVALGWSSVAVAPAVADEHLDELVVVEGRGDGGSCVSTNGFPRHQSGSSFCGTSVQGDRAVAINNSTAYGNGFVGDPSTAFARNDSGAFVQLGSSATALNLSQASARSFSTAYAADSSLAEAIENSSATASGDSYARAAQNSVAVATNGACAIAISDGGPGQESRAIADGPGEIVYVYNGVLQPPDPSKCRVWPGPGPWPG